MVQQVVTRLAALALDAVAELETLLKTSKMEMVRLQAAKAIIHGLLTVGTYSEVQDQLEAVLDGLAEIKRGAHDRGVAYPFTTPPA
jgi:hypothetical protein